MAQAMSMPGVYDVATQRVGWLYRLVFDWAGDDGFVQQLSVRIRRPNVVGDVTRVKGRVVRKARKGDDAVVDMEVWCENQTGQVTAPGTAVVTLPALADGVTPRSKDWR